jgi:hypothetical protein
MESSVLHVRVSNIVRYKQCLRPSSFPAKVRVNRQENHFARGLDMKSSEFGVGDVHFGCSD